MKRTKKQEVPERRAFRAVATPGEALAIDPGGAGLIAAAQRGQQVTPDAFAFESEKPQAIYFQAEENEWCPSSIVAPGVAALDVFGPLEHHGGWWWCSYENILRETRRAAEYQGVERVILNIDSPGGVASGMTEVHDGLRLIQKETGVPVYAWVSGMACSAAYNIASACREMWLPRDGVAGSIGVILATVDTTKALEKDGVSVRYVVTGERKADLHPGAPVTDEVLRVAQEKVDYLGALFFESVARARSMKPKAVQALQAAVFYGENAVAARLADGVSTWPKFLSMVAGSIQSQPQTAQQASARAPRAVASARPSTRSASRPRAPRSPRSL